MRRFLRIESARRSIAAGKPFLAGLGLEGRRSFPLVRSWMLASMRIWSPNFAYWPQITVSALLESRYSAQDRGIDDVSAPIRRSCKIWCKRSGETVRKCADWPTSVLSMSAKARAVPVQRRILGRIAEGQNRQRDFRLGSG